MDKDHDLEVQFTQAVMPNMGSYGCASCTPIKGRQSNFGDRGNFIGFVLSICLYILANLISKCWTCLICKYYYYISLILSLFLHSLHLYVSKKSTLQTIIRIYQYTNEVYFLPIKMQHLICNPPIFQEKKRNLNPTNFKILL